VFRKLDLFRSSGEEGEKTPTQLGSLERANSITTPTSEPFKIYLGQSRYEEHNNSNVLGDKAETDFFN
jgi:hypothetical protein